MQQYALMQIADLKKHYKNDDSKFTIWNDAAENLKEQLTDSELLYLLD